MKSKTIIVYLFITLWAFPTALFSANLKYIGAFNVPSLSGGEGETFAWAGRGLAYNPGNNTLFMTGHIYQHLVAEISIPTPVINNNYSELPEAVIQQTFSDITEGNLANIGQNGAAIPQHAARLGGLLVSNNKLYGTSYAYYEGANDATLSHFSSSLNLPQTGDFSGMYKVSTLNPGMIAGYMTLIPENKQAFFNGSTALTGNACLSIISRSSYGPSAFTFTPELISQSNPSHSTALVYYPSAHPTLGDWDNETYASPIYNMATQIHGIVFPKDSDTVIFFGRTGLGIPKYGAGTSDESLHGTPIPDYPEEDYVYDPANHDKGCHAWPYSGYIWEYNIEDLALVLNGSKKPWEIEPASHSIIDFPYTDETSEYQLGGATYDSSRNKIYLSLLNINRERPVILVFDLLPNGQAAQTSVNLLLLN